MIDIQDLQSKLNKMLNGKENPNNIRISDYISDYEFIVLSYAQYLDSIYNVKTNKNSIPVYIGEPSGTVEPIPTLKEINMQYNITLYFPISLKEKFFKLMNYFIDAFAGRMIDFEGESGSALCNCTVPNFGEISSQEFTQFQDYLKNHYKIASTRTEMRGCYNFILYFHQIGNLGKEGGFILANEISYQLSFEYNDKEFTDEVVLASSARNYTADPISQQVLGESQTYSINKNSSYGDSIEIYAKNNSFWKMFIELYELGLLQNVSFKFTKNYISLSKKYTKEVLLVSCPQNLEYGEAMTFTFVFSNLAEVENV